MVRIKEDRMELEDESPSNIRKEKERAVRRESAPIFVALERSDEAMGQLESRFVELTKVLDPVLGPDRPLSYELAHPAEPEDEIEDEPSPLARRLHDHAAQLEVLCIRLEGMIAQVEV